MEPKSNSIQLSAFLKYGFNRNEKSSIVDFRLGSKYASVNIILHLTFFKIT